MSWFSRAPARGLARANPIATAAVVVGVGMLAVMLAWICQGYAEHWATRLVTSRAIGQMESTFLSDIGADDLSVSRPGQVEALAARLHGRLARLQQERNFDIIQVNVYAMDGMVLFADQAERIGRKIPPSRVPRLAGALAGTVNTRLLALSPSDDADLTDRYAEVLAIYAPISRDGEIMAAAELYADLMPIRIARLATWIGIVGTVAVGLLLYVRMRLVQQGDQLERLTREAFFDSLTGLANRALFRFRLHQAFHRAERRGETLVVMFLDLDRFKSVNDTLGHVAGDHLLIAVGERLSASVRPEDTVARLGGDEFTVLLESVPSLAEATTIADRILAAMREPFVLAGQERSVRTSIGLAARTPLHTSPDEVLRDADAALYQAKEAGKDRYTVYRPEPDAPVARAS